MNPKGPFKYSKDNEDKDGSIFELRTQLEDDGCPDSERFLRIQVITHDLRPSTVILDIVGKNKMRRIGFFETGDIAGIADLLYGAAKIVTVQTIEPLINK